MKLLTSLLKYVSSRSKTTNIKIESELTPIKESPFIGNYTGNMVLNPDSTLEIAIGKEYNISYGLQIYDEMEKKDTHIASCLSTRKHKIIRKPYQIMCEATDDLHRSALEFVKYNLFEIIIDIESKLNHILDALGKGYSVSEKIYKIIDGKISLIDLKHRQPWLFYFDLEGDLIYNNVINPAGIKLPKEKFVIMTYNKKYENYYGESVLGEGVFWWYWFKKNIVKFWVTFLDKYGMPTPIGKYPKYATQNEKKSLLEMINNLKNNYGAVIPEDQFLEFLEANVKSVGKESVYAGFIELANAEISKKILGQTLTTETHNTGSLAQSQVHERILDEIISADCVILQNLINQQIIKPLVDLNFENIKYYPYWKYEIEKKIDQNTRIDVLTKLKGIGIDVDPKQIREEFNLI